MSDALIEAYSGQGVSLSFEPLGEEGNLGGTTGAIGTLDREEGSWEVINGQLGKSSAKEPCGGAGGVGHGRWLLSGQGRSLEVVDEFLGQAGIVRDFIGVEVDLVGDGIADILLHFGDGETGINDGKAVLRFH